MILFHFRTYAQLPGGTTVLVDQTYMCGGTLITRDTILTAAHCAPKTVEYDYNGQTYEIPVQANTLSPTIPSMFTVYLGMNDISGLGANDLLGGVNMSVSNVITVMKTYIYGL